MNDTRRIVSELQKISRALEKGSSRELSAHLGKVADGLRELKSVSKELRDLARSIEKSTPQEVVRSIRDLSNSTKDQLRELREQTRELERQRKELENQRRIMANQFTAQIGAQAGQQELQRMEVVSSYRARLIEFSILAATASGFLLTLAISTWYLPKVLYIISTIIFVITCALEGWQLRPRPMGTFGRIDTIALGLFLVGLVVFAIATLTLFSPDIPALLQSIQTS